MQKQVLILGAGPAGLMAAWPLMEAGYKVTILDRDNKVGGMCATQTFQGERGEYRFDYGGHRFITKNPELLEFVDKLMGDDLLYAQRKSVIRYRDRIYSYPLAAKDLLKNAPFSLLIGAGIDLLKQLFKAKPQDRSEVSFAQWIESRFGKTLYKHFFEGYTAKLWGIDPKNLSGDWASQRISLINLKDVVRRLLPSSSATPRTYAKQYRYPKLGFGQLYDKLAQKLIENGVSIELNSDVCEAEVSQQDNGKKIHKIGYKTDQGVKYIECEHLISTLPLDVMCKITGFDSGLTYRALRFFNMPMQTENISDNTWQYLSDPHILGTRLQEPRRRSPHMSPQGVTSVMIEIPCNKDDDTWNMPTEQLKERVYADLTDLNIDPTLSCKSEYLELVGRLLRPDYRI